MKPSQQPQRRFTGIFLPVEILDISELTLLEKVLLSWIDALFDEKKGGCFASNEYLGDKLNAEPNTISKSIGKLRKLGLIEDISFDGRERVIRSLIAKFIDKSQEKSKADLDLNPSSIGKKSNAAYDKNPSTPIYESKEDRKDIKPPTPLKGEYVCYGKFVKLTKEEFEEAREVCGGTNQLSAIIEEINDYLASTGNKPYKDYLATIRNWIRRKSEKAPLSATGSIKSDKTSICLDLERKLIGEGFKGRIEISDKEISIFTNGHAYPFTLAFAENGFKQQLASQLRKMTYHKLAQEIENANN